jgi:dTDP-4-amino-4,6-dideoxygalactose transaminase
MHDLASLAKRHGLAVLEDAAQAHGASLDAVPVGAWGDVAAFSFYPTKNMTSGEGGMVVTPHEEVARRARLVRNQGMEARYRNEIVGYNLRMTDIHAAIGRVQLGRLEELTRRRRRNAHFLTANLQGLGTPSVAPGAVHVYHQYTVRVADDRDGFARALADEHGVGTGVYYPVPVHLLPSFDRQLDLPETARAAREVLSLPVHPALSDGDLDRIVTRWRLSLGQVAVERPPRRSNRVG